MSYLHHSELSSVSTIKIPADYLPLLKEASRLFKETEPREEFALFGVVVKLDRRPGADSGEVTINSVMEERPRKVVLELTDPDYQTAIRAHQEMIPVSCTGELVKEGKSFRLRNPRQFQLLETEDSSL